MAADITHAVEHVAEPRGSSYALPLVLSTLAFLAWLTVVVSFIWAIAETWR